MISRGVVSISALVVLLLLPASQALPGLGNCRAEGSHVYVQGPLQGGFPTLVTPPGCPDGTDASLGVGGVFLAAEHHLRHVCIADLVYSEASYSVQVDGNGDGILSPDATPEDRATPFESGCNLVPFGPGADGGWWVILGSNAVRGTLVTR
jgi:hypothetical protein